jgi:release factor glutamine methyltransferase
MREQVALSIQAARARAAAQLLMAGVDSPALDARLLLEAATGLDAAAQAASPERLLTEDERLRFEALLARRQGREPMAQILGRAGFWGIELWVTRHVLTPRPETETILEAALEATEGRSPGRVLDLGVGPGTLLFAFLYERPGWIGVGVDLSTEALAVAAENARRLGQSRRAFLLQGDWDAALADRQPFDLILANPPYIPSADIGGLEPEVRDHEPRLALDGGTDGLDVYRRLAQALPGLLAPEGLAVFETGVGQGAAVAGLMRAAIPQAGVMILNDLGGRDRAVVVRRRDLAGR